MAGGQLKQQGRTEARRSNPSATVRMLFFAASCARAHRPAIVPDDELRALDCVWVRGRVLGANVRRHIALAERRLRRGLTAVGVSSFMPLCDACDYATLRRSDHCTYNKTVDFRISADIQRTGCYECRAVDYVLQRLRDRDAVLLDLGANIGAFSVPAAADGHPVIAFEPVPANAARLRASFFQNNVSAARVVEACVGEAPGWALLGTHPTNQGGPAHPPLARGAARIFAALAAHGRVAASGVALGTPRRLRWCRL